MKHFGVNQGLPSTECYAVMQDSRGYLWVATDAGVAKYDGYKFITYNGSKGLPDNTVFKIHEDNHGRIWFATYSGKMAFYSYRTDSIYGIPLNPKLDSLNKYVPIDFCFDGADTLYLSLFKKGYIKAFPPYYKTMNTYFSKESMYFIKSVGKNLLYGNVERDTSAKTKQSGLYRVPEVHLKPVFYLDTAAGDKVPAGFLSSLNIHHSSIKYNAGILFSCGVGLFDVLRGRMLIRWSYKEKKQPINLFRDQENRLWISRLTDGSYVYKSPNFNQAPQHILPGLSVTSMCQDGDRGLWLTTLENGLYYIPSLGLNYSEKSPGVSSGKILSIAFLGNDLYSLDANFMLNRLDTSRLSTLSSEKLPSSAWYLSPDGACMLVCISNSYLLNPGGRKIFLNMLFHHESRYVKIKKAIPYNDTCLLGYNDGTVLFINKKSGRVDALVPGLPRIFSIYRHKGTIWVGTKSGLYSYKDQVLRFYGKDNEFLNYRIEDIASMGDTLFMATRGQGILCMYHNKLVGRYTEADGLASNMVKCLCVGSNGNLWVGTNRGISGLKKTGNGFIFHTLDLSNGLVSNEANQIIEHHQKLYVATNDGVESIDISVFDKTGAPIPVYVEKFYVNNVASSLLPDRQFTYNQNFINIAYKGISIKSEGDIRYKYRLEGLDTNWTYSKNTFVQYTTLPPGHYRFTVYAINSDGLPSLQPAAVSFEIGKPFWCTWWFRVLAAVTLCSAAYYIYRSRIKEIRQREKEKADIRRKISESELKALRAQMNPHFMFNAINSIQNFVLKNDAGSAQKYLTKFARLIRSVLENSKYEAVTLKKEIEALELYVELEALRASFGFDYDIAVDENVDADIIRIPPMIIQPYIENAILHGLMPLTDRKGMLSIRFSRLDDTLLCTIDDNGIGRAKAEEIRFKKQLSHQSMGMSVTQDRISILNQHRHTLSAKVNIHDKITDGLAEGTTIEISINIKNPV